MPVWLTVFIGDLEGACCAQSSPAKRQKLSQRRARSPGISGYAAWRQACFTAARRSRSEAFRDTYGFFTDSAPGEHQDHFASVHRKSGYNKDATAIVWLDYPEAITGTHKVIEVDVSAACSQCKGTKGQTQVCCALCDGRGSVLCSGGMASLCPACGGSGSQTRQWCSGCGGTGLTTLKKAVQVRIPPGVKENSILKLKGCGNMVEASRSPGDLYVSFVIRARWKPSRDGQELPVKVSVSYIDAILGSLYTVNTSSGPTQLLIPPGTQHGTRLRAELSKKAGCAETAPLDVVNIFEVVLTLPHQISGKEEHILSQIGGRE